MQEKLWISNVGLEAATCNLLFNLLIIFQINPNIL